MVQQRDAQSQLTAFIMEDTFCRKVKTNAEGTIYPSCHDHKPVQYELCEKEKNGSMLLDKLGTQVTPILGSGQRITLSLPGQSSLWVFCHKSCSACSLPSSFTPNIARAEILPKIGKKTRGGKTQKHLRGCLSSLKFSEHCPPELVYFFCLIGGEGVGSFSIQFVLNYFF